MLKESSNKYLDIALLRKDFPILTRKVNGMPLIYFDNGATTQKPQAVLNAINEFYREHNANIHRGVHTLSREATEIFEQSRKEIASFFNASEQQIVFTSGTSDSINMIAQGLAVNTLKKGDEIIVSAYEHHSNILPWQLWAERNEGKLKVIPMREDQSLDLSQLEKLITEKTKVISITHVSNSLGLITDLEIIKAVVKKFNLILVIDGAQSAPHMQVDLSSLDPDFFACSAHKIYGPTGTGILYMSKKWMSEMPVMKPGGGTIKTVSFSKTEYAEGPLRFEAGTPNMEGVIGFAAAVKYLRAHDMVAISNHETELVNDAQQKLSALEEVTLYGKSKNKAAVISFNVKNAHPFDVGTLLDKYGIAVRTGHHCTQPLMDLLCVPGTVRISFALYNSKEEIDFFVEKLKKVISMLK